MSHLRMLQPDPSDPSEQPRAVADATEQAEPDAGLFLAHLTSTLAAHGGGATSVDLAVDLVLNEIVEQARLATTATAAAIALSRDQEMVCRATTGPNAPDLGVRLTTHSGLSAACVTTRQVQRCDDTETDPRVDAATCRDLGIRSMLVVPVLDAEELAGVFEIFSPRPHAFGDRDVQTLQALSLRIVSTLHRATEAASPVTMPPAATGASDEKIQAESPLPEPLVLQPRIAAAPPRDYGTAILTALVVALALLLGWMLGRAGWQGAMRTRAARSVQSPKGARLPPGTAPPQPAMAVPVEAGKNATADGLSPASAKRSSAPPDNALVVYENGKVIFRMAPAQKSSQPEASAPLPASSEDASAPAGMATLSPELAGKYLIQRVEPDYPDEARQQRIQGEVVMDTVVGKDGTVHEVRPVSGDSRLSEAAMAAVRQWRYKPYNPNGQPVEFLTRVAVKFTLP
ncbi:MAG: TonB family protein [Acidobacteriia bacterium]|nr:TonB family protein [Terriglobia bacterium]